MLYSSTILTNIKCKKRWYFSLCIILFWKTFRTQQPNKINFLEFNRISKFTWCGIFFSMTYVMNKKMCVTLKILIANMLQINPWIKLDPPLIIQFCMIKRGPIIKFHTGISSQQNEWNTHKIIDTTKKIFMSRLSIKQKR